MVKQVSKALDATIRERYMLLSLNEDISSPLVKEIITVPRKFIIPHITLPTMERQTLETMLRDSLYWE